MVIQNEQKLSSSLLGLRDVNPVHNEGNLNDIKTVLDTQKRYLVLIGKFQQLCIKFAERNTLEDLKKAHVFATCVFKMEAELKVLNSGYYTELTLKYLDSYEREIKALDVTEATTQINKLLAKKVIQTKEKNRKRGKTTYTFEKAKEVCKIFSEQNPKLLNIGLCRNGIKVQLGDALEDEMEKPENFLQLASKKTPNRDTVDRNINNALKGLGFEK